MNLRWIILGSIFGLTSAPLSAQEIYREPPEVIREVLRAQPFPAYSLSPDAKFLLSVRYEWYPPIAELAAPMHRLAGVRVDPRNNSVHAMSKFPCELVLKALPDGKERRIQTRAGLRCTSIDWSPDGRHFAFFGIETDAVRVWIGDAHDASARQVPDLAVNLMMMHPLVWMPDGKSLLAASVPTTRGAPPVAGPPLGPEVQDSSSVAKASSTYEARDLLRTAHDADLFEFYGQSQLTMVDLQSLETRRLGAAAVIGALQAAPDGQYLLVTRVLRPYAFSRPWNRFPRAIDVWDLDGKLVETVASLPLADQVPIDGVATGARNIRFIPTEAHTLWWVEALDQGDWAVKASKRDRLLRKVVGAPARTWLDLDQRFSDLNWVEGGEHALVHEWERDRRWTMSFVLRARGDDPQPRLLWDRSYNDAYADPGYPVHKSSFGGHRLVRRDGERIWLSGNGSTAGGNRPFLDELNLTTLKTERWFRSDAAALEWFVAWDDPARGSFYSSRQSPRDPPNLMRRVVVQRVARANAGEATRSSKRTPVTAEKDPTPAMRGISKQLVTFKRKDGVQLSMSVFLPPGYQAGTRVPTLLWAYPTEYSDKGTAGQVDAAPNAFIVPYGAAFELLPLAGYAVIDVAMPIVGPPETVYESFVEQIVDNAEATIDQAVKMGFADRDRIGVFGHSHGALMTANLLIWSDLFRAGVARSGAYNHTLRPFGFQTEHRTLYQAKDTYLKLSPTLNADKVNEPLLLIHGAIDANPGTVPLQSEKLFEAVRGVGGTARLVMLPYESHGYQGRESIGQVLAETVDWFDRFVKNAPARVSSMPASAAAGE
jgi:dipeptidyl aminopeptidase/acylaminoacyl peptidase